MKTLESNAHRGLVRPLLALVAAGALALAACGPAEEPAGDTAPPPADQETTMQEVKDKVGDAMKAIESFTYENKEEFETWADNRLRKLDDRMAALEARGEELGDEAAEGWQDTLADLRARRGELDSQLESARGSSADAWDEIKSGFGQAQRKLSRSLDRAAEDLGLESGSG